MLFFRIWALGLPSLPILHFVIQSVLARKHLPNVDLTSLTFLLLVRFRDTCDRKGRRSRSAAVDRRVNLFDRFQRVDVFDTFVCPNPNDSRESKSKAAFVPATPLDAVESHLEHHNRLDQS